MPSISQPHSDLNVMPTASLEAWLHYDKPITDKLQKLTGDAQLELLSQGWINSTAWDAHVLHVQEPVLQREIFMKSRFKVYWYARAVIPQSCYDLEPVFFNRLERESIRNLVFDEPKVRLVQKIVYPVNAQCPEFQWIKKQLSSVQEILWVRLAEFSFLQAGSFYLIEILFPDLQELT